MSPVQLPVRSAAAIHPHYAMRNRVDQLSDAPSRSRDFHDVRQLLQTS